MTKGSGKKLQECGAMLGGVDEFVAEHHDQEVLSICFCVCIVEIKCEGEGEGDVEVSMKLMIILVVQGDERRKEGRKEGKGEEDM